MQPWPLLLAAAAASSAAASTSGERPVAVMRGLLLLRGLRVPLTVLEEEEESLRLRWSDGIESLRRPPDPAAPTLLPEPGVMADSGLRSIRSLVALCHKTPSPVSSLPAGQAHFSAHPAIQKTRGVYSGTASSARLAGRPAGPAKLKGNFTVCGWLRGRFRSAEPSK